jgi:hypothetical protein
VIGTAQVNFGWLILNFGLNSHPISKSANQKKYFPLTSFLSPSAQQFHFKKVAYRLGVFAKLVHQRSHVAK